MTPDLIVADAGPLIGLAIAGRVELLGALFEREHVIDQIAPILDELASHGYRLSDELRRELLIMAGEA